MSRGGSLINAVCFHTNKTNHCIADDQTWRSHFVVCVCVCVCVCERESASEYVRMSMCMWFSLPGIFCAAACQRGWGNFIMYAMLLEFISYYLSCIKYEPFSRPSRLMHGCGSTVTPNFPSSSLLFFSENRISYVPVAFLFLVQSEVHVVCQLCPLMFEYTDWHNNMHMRDSQSPENLTDLHSSHRVSLRSGLSSLPNMWCEYCSFDSGWESSHLDRPALIATESRSTGSKAKHHSCLLWCSQ